MTDQNNTENSTENAARNDQNTETPGNNTETRSETRENMIPKSRFDQVNQQKNELNEILKGLVDELKQDIPEDYRDLVPDTKPADQIKWIRNAMKKGLFTKQAQESPDPETPAKGTKQINTEGLDSFSMLSLGFKNQKK